MEIVEVFRVNNQVLMCIPDCTSVFSRVAFLPDAASNEILFTKNLVCYGPKPWGFAVIN